MQRGWWKGAVALLVTVGMLAQHLEVARAADVIEIGVPDSTPCVVNDPIYDPVGDVCGALDRWEADAVTVVKQSRGITGGTDNDVRAFGAADVRAELFSRMIRAIQKPAAQRTADESAVVTWLQNVQQRKNIEIAEQALTEFTAYDGPAGNTGEGAGWCTYTPPAPYQNDRPAWTPCNGIHNPLGGLFTLPPTYPDAETWVKWGAAKVNKDAFALAGHASSTELSAAAVAGIAAASAGIAAGSAFAGLTAALSEAFIVTIWPFATSAFSAVLSYAGVTAAEALAAATATAFAAAAFIVVVVAIALYGIIYSGLQVFERGNIRTELENGITAARSASLPDLAAYAADSTGVGELYDVISTYLTLNDGTPIPRVAPARTASDMLVERTGAPTVTTTVRTWNGTSATLEVRGGYLVLDGVATTGAQVLDRNGDPVTMFRAKTSTGAWGFILVPATDAHGSCLTTTTVTCAPLPVADILDGNGVYKPLRTVTDAAPSLQLHAEAKVSGGSTYDLTSDASWNGQSLAASTVWWRPDATTHASGIFTSNVSVCLPWTDPSGTTVPADADTELFNGVCYRKFAAGATATFSVLTNAAVTIRGSVTSPSGQVANSTVELPANTAVAALTLTPPTPSTVDEGQVWVLAGQVVDGGGPSQAITVTLDWHDGTTAQTFTIPPVGTTLIQIGFQSTRSGNTSNFTVSKNLNDEASGSVTVTVQGSATATASTNYAARNVAPTVDTIAIDGCDGTPSCVLTPGQTVTVRGRLSDRGVLDDPTASVSFTGGSPVAASLTAGRLIRVTGIGQAQTPMPWDFVAQLTVPSTGTASTTLTVAADDGDGGTVTTTKSYEQYLTSTALASVTATAVGPDSIEVAYIANLSFGSTLALTFNASCRSTDGASTGTGTGASPIRITGLTPGKTYSCKVFSRSSAGDGPATTAADITLPTGIPGAPTGVTATAGLASRVSVAFSPVASSLTVGYAAACSSSTGTNGSATGATSPLEVSGLTAGATYVCTVTASTTYGAGNASSPSNAVTVLGLPGAPTNVVATPTETAGATSVSFTPPTDLGGASSVSYEAVCSAAPTQPVGRATGTSSPITVTGLDKGGLYSCVVTATTTAGTTSSASVKMPFGYPDAVTSVVATAKGVGSVELTFTPGASPLSVTYQATCSTDGQQVDVTGSASPIVLAGLTVGASYVCRVLAVTSWGANPKSIFTDISISNPVVVLGQLTAPTGVVATISAASTLSVSFAPITAPVPVTYSATCSSATGASGTATGPGSPIVVSGLTGGASYRCVVTAVGSHGSSAESSASSAVTVPGVPSAPGRPTVSSPNDRRSPARVEVAFTAPASNGGSPITSYRVSCASTDGAWVRSASGPRSPIAISGFTAPETTFTCTVIATNRYGDSAASSPSAVVTAYTVPAAPAAPTATRLAPGRVAVVIAPPASSTKYPVLEYWVTCRSLDRRDVESESSSSNRIVVSGLRSKRDYRCTAWARNALGWSEESPASAVFTA